MMPRYAVVPQPALLEAHEGSFVLTVDTAIAASKGATGVAIRLQEDLRAGTGLPLPLAAQGQIELTLDPSAGLGAEGYCLDVEAEGIQIVASAPAGLFWGTRTLLQLLPPAVLRKAPLPGVVWEVPAVHIVDQPRFGYRGSHLDVGRHFMPKEFLLKHLDVMALHKLNVLHLHLTEDQGWRIEIKKYPKLTEVGAWRKETMAGHYEDRKWDGKPHGGFYTQEDLREVVAYAAARHIEVMPEIELPGHSQAAIAAYPELGNLDKPIEVATSWGIIEHVFNVEESTVQFLKDVFDEVLDIFPCKFIHVGGDECPKKEWKESPRAQELMKQRGLKDEEELQSWFIRQMDVYLESKGRRLVGWDEILEGGLAPGATVMSWRGEEGGIAAAKAGHDVIMTPGSHTYFDHYQVEDKANEPVAIGGFTSLEKAYSYEPIPAELTADEASRVLGAQGQLWTEYMPNPKHVEYMAWPRMCALAEAVWTPKEGRNWPDFKGRMEVHGKRLEAADVAYCRKA